MIEHENWKKLLEASNYRIANDAFLIDYAKTIKKHFALPAMKMQVFYDNDKRIGRCVLVHFITGILMNNNRSIDEALAELKEVYALSRKQISSIDKMLNTGDFDEIKD